MIILDTNVLSTLMSQAPEVTVVAWLDHQIPEEIWLTAITVFETRYGLARLPPGRRRHNLESAFDRLLVGTFTGRIAPVDRAAANAAGLLAAKRRAAGFNIEIRDTLIAGIAVDRRATIATRNIKDFAGLNVPIVNPWGPET